MKYSLVGFSKLSNQSKINKDKNSLKDYLWTKKPILGDQVGVSQVRKSGGESFQERARSPLGCYY